MDADAKKLRDEIVNDMYSIRTTLLNSANSVRNQKGVGCEFCADRLESIRSRYWGYISTLNSLK